MEHRELTPLGSRLVFADSAAMASVGREWGQLELPVMETSAFMVMFFPSSAHLLLVLVFFFASVIRESSSCMTQTAPENLSIITIFLDRYKETSPRHEFYVFEGWGATS